MKSKKQFRNPLLMRILLLSMLLSVSTVIISAAPVKIMPLGDSITAGQGCWRSILWNALQTNGYTNIDFVGSVISGGCPLSFDTDCEGHGGIAATGMADQNQLPPWLAAVNPDIVIMHLGTNDCFGIRDVTLIINAFSKLVDQMRANNPNMKIIVAKIIPMNPATNPDGAQMVITLNNAIPAWASGKTTSQSPVIVVDQWTGFDPVTDTVDGIHPNSLGEQKIADKWYPALISFLSQTNTSQPTSTIIRTATRTVSATTTATPVITATRTSTGPTATRTRTSTSATASRTTTGTATRTVTAISTPTIVITATPATTGCTCAAGCSAVTAITPNFAKDGVGQVCYSAASLGSYINSWNLTTLNVNGVDLTNKYVAAASLPAKINGIYYVYYNCTVSWGHFEAVN